MPSINVVYPDTGSTKFDHGYWGSTHKDLVHQHMGGGLTSISFTRGLHAPGGDPSPVHGIAHISYDSMASLEAALGAAGPVIADIPNYTDTTPQMMIGEEA